MPLNIFEGLKNDLLGAWGTRFLIGVNCHENVDVTAGNVAPTMLNCRAISVDDTGIAKFSYVDEYDGTTKTKVMTLNEGTLYYIRNVNNVFRYYTGTTDLTAKSYDSTGVLKIGLTLWR